jgi:diamine N-acetyltransferase
MDSILRRGLDTMGLDKIYWCVSPENRRAVRFYDKHRYPRVDVGPLQPVGYSREQLEAYIWYAVTKADLPHL